MDQDWGLPGLPTENPPANVDSDPGDFNFGLMTPGRLFTMGGQQFRYLENQGGGNHLIIRERILGGNAANQNTVFATWYTDIIRTIPTLEAMVQPVSIPNPAPGIADGSVVWSGARWLPTNLPGAVSADASWVSSDGTKRAFALSLSDVARVSGGGRGFANAAQRLSTTASGTHPAGWWLRTPGATGANRAWLVWLTTDAQLNAHNTPTFNRGFDLGGVLP